MKILITGGLGHIGSYLLENINKIKSVKKVYVIDSLVTNRYFSLFNIKKTGKKIYFYHLDLTLPKTLEKFKKVDVVINLASLTNKLKGSKRYIVRILSIFIGVFTKEARNEIFRDLMYYQVLKKKQQ